MDNKELYLAPMCEEFELRPEGVIAQSEIPDVPYGGEIK